MDTLQNAVQHRPETVTLELTEEALGELARIIADKDDRIAEREALLSKALESIELLQEIRCHPRRHDLEREWLTKADAVIGYWQDTRTAQAIRNVIGIKGSHE